MAKKKLRRKKKTPPSLFSAKKIRKLLFRTILIGGGVAAGVLARPSIIPDAQKREQVEQIREQVLKANDEAQEKALEVLDSSTDVLGTTIETVSEITKEFTNTDPQAVIQEKVETFSEDIKNLPEKQIKKIKLEFCQDVIEEIELTCEKE